MIRKVIENWLISTKEREYQLPFCQLLSSQGHEILHVSSHGPGEHGKDIVTIAPDGKPCAYQLKTGDIKTEDWRRYGGEVIELVKHKIRHPAIEKKRGWHRSYLVLNGRLTQDVKDSIDMQNEDYKDVWSHLDIIEFDQLLGGFVEMQGDFYATELQDTKLFLELLLADGQEPLPTGRFAEFLLSMLPLEGSPSKTTKTACRRAIASSMLMSAYIGQQYAEQANHLAMIDLWITFLAYVLAVADRFALEDKYWHSTYDLAIMALESAFLDAAEEVGKRSDCIYDLNEGNWVTDFAYLRPRLLKIAGYLSAFALYRKIAGTDEWRIPVIDNLLEKYHRLFLVTNDRLCYGEAAIPQQLAIAWYMESTGRPKDASGLVVTLMNLILILGNKGGTPNPYYDTEAYLRHQYGIEPIEETFAKRSYHLRSLVEWLARRLWRQHITRSWRDISYMHCCEFVPAEKWGYFLWRCKKGEEQSRFPDQTQSWAELQKDYPDVEFPKVLLRHPEFLPLFLVVYPHRLTPAFSWKVDMLLRHGSHGGQVAQ